MPLICLALDTVEAALGWRQPNGLNLANLLHRTLLDWQDQRRTFGFSEGLALGH